jgi:hypothetical protein
MAKICAICGGAVPRGQDAHVDEQAPLPGTKPSNVTYTWPLGGGAKAEVIFTSEPTQAQLDALIAQLKIMRDIEPT